MRFYRLEKENYFKKWTFAILKSLLISTMIIVSLMLMMGYKFMIVISSSMEPTLPVGCLVLVTPADYEDLELKDIVTMRKASGLNLTHRIVGKGYSDSHGDVTYIEEGEEGYESAMWCTKGDNSDTHDGEINGEIVGVIKENHVFELTGDIVRYIQNNKMVVIIFIVLFIVFFEAVSYLKNKMVIEDIESYDWDEE